MLLRYKSRPRYRAGIGRLVHEQHVCEISYVSRFSEQIADAIIVSLESHTATLHSGSVGDTWWQKYEKDLKREHFGSILYII